MSTTNEDIEKYLVETMRRIFCELKPDVQENFYRTFTKIENEGGTIVFSEYDQDAIREVIVHVESLMTKVKSKTAKSLIFIELFNLFCSLEESTEERFQKILEQMVLICSKPMDRCIEDATQN